MELVITCANVWYYTIEFLSTSATLTNINYYLKIILYYYCYEQYHNINMLKEIIFPIIIKKIIGNEIQYSISIT